MICVAKGSVTDTERLLSGKGRLYSGPIPRVPLGTDKSSHFRRTLGFVIALHSPDGVVETGLRICHPEKETPSPRSWNTIASPSSVVTDSVTGTMFVIIDARVIRKADLAADIRRQMRDAGCDF
jgi:hypothetical protein